MKRYLLNDAIGAVCVLIAIGAAWCGGYTHAVSDSYRVCVASFDADYATIAREQCIGAARSDHGNSRLARWWKP
jgi:hypothetical protein